MKNILLTLTLALAFTVSKASEKEIIAEVVFENLTGEELNSGEFFIIETNDKIEIKGTQSFKITLPSKGKYQFGITTEGFTAYTFYPSRITNKKNTITIQLVEKIEFTFNNRTLSFPMNLDINLSDEQIEKKIAEENLNFIIHRIESSIPKYLSHINIEWLSDDIYIINYNNGFGLSPFKILPYLGNDDVLIEDFEAYINSYRKK